MSETAAPDRPFPLGSPAPDGGPPREAYDRRVAFHRRQLEALEQQAAEVRRGGGTRATQRQHDRGKLTARERIDALLDDGAAFREIGLFAGRGMYEDEGGCPAGGTVMGLGRVSGRLCMIVANDATVKAGAWFPITAKKNLRAQEIALENRVPILYLVDSAGVFLPMQDEIFPDRDHFGRIFRNNARLIGAGRAADRGHHGELRGRRGLPPHHVRREPDRRRHGLGLPGRPVPRAGRHRRGGRRRDARRRDDADRHLGRLRVQDAGRRDVPRDGPRPRRRARAAPALRVHPRDARGARPSRRTRSSASSPRAASSRTTRASSWPGSSTPTRGRR